MHRSRKGTALVLAMGFGCLVASPDVHAQSKADADAADQLFRSAKAAMDRGNLAVACPQLAESQRKDPAPGTLLNLAECESRWGKLSAALGHFQDARAALPAGDYRVAFADDHIAVLLHRMPRLAVHVKGELTPELRVQRDGAAVDVGTLGTPTPVNPGGHHVVATRNGQVVAQADVMAEEGQLVTADLVLEAGPPSATHASTQRTWGLGLLGVGGASFVVGAAFGVVAKVTYDAGTSSCPHGTASCNASGVSDGQSAHAQAAIATGAMVAGAALMAVGLTVVLTAPKEGSVTVTATGSGLSIGGAW